MVTGPSARRDRRGQMMEFPKPALKFSSSGLATGAWRYFAVAALPLCLALLQQAAFNAQMQDMRDQIMQPQQMMQPQMNGPQMDLSRTDQDIPYGLAPVDLPIENIGQETPVWCWAAVSQQIIAASKGAAETPAQCALVATANNAPASLCCADRDPRCTTTGSLQQVQSLIQHFGGRTSAYAEPTDAMTLYRTLKLGHAVVIGIDAGNGMGHVVVARGMSFEDTPQGVVAMVHINDPMAHFTRPVPFGQVASVWRQAIIVN